MALSNLNDGILYFIQCSCDHKLNEAKAIIERIHCRKFVSDEMMMMMMIVVMIRIIYDDDDDDDNNDVNDDGDFNDDDG